MHTHTHAHSQTCTCTHTPVAYQGNETEEKVFKKRKIFKEDLKELTEVVRQTETMAKLQARLDCHFHLFQLRFQSCDPQ